MTNFKYFNVNELNNLEELKKAYRKLAKQYHPDLNENDTTNDMKQINNEYEQLFKTLHKTASKKEQTQHKTATAFKDIINNIIHMNVNIDIVGSWVWVYADYNTIKHYKEELKQNGFKYSASNKKWYWTEQELKKRKKATSYQYKIEKYGKDSVKSKKDPLKID